MNESMINNCEILKYSKKEIEKAGKEIAKSDSISEYSDYCLNIVDNWRAAHAYPLEEISSLIKTASNSYENTYFAKRLKRLDSIIGKLKRLKESSLYRMQDLGGCRIIVPKIEMINEVIEKVKDILLINGHEIVREYDYLNTPRQNSGYRSYHIVTRFHKNNSLCDGMLLEIQVRTRLQHLWATAVEIIDATNLMNSISSYDSIQQNDIDSSLYSLKGGNGNREDMSFFKLVSGLFSLKENLPIVEGIPTTKKALINEIYNLDEKIKIRERLSAYNSAIKFTGEYPKNADYYLLITNMKEHSIETLTFYKEDIEKATSLYMKKENEKEFNNKLDVVLVSVSHFSYIRECYPNYFLDTSNFLMEIRNLCLSYPEKSSLLLKLNQFGNKITDLFKISEFKSNIPKDVAISGDGIGCPSSNLVFCPAWSVSLENSYLRFSGVNWNPNAELETMLDALIISDPAIVVLETGASFIIDKKNWAYFSETNSILIQPYDNDINKLFLLIAWLKSNVCTWNILWNNHAKCVFDSSVYSKFTVPFLDPKDIKVIINCTKELLKMESNFVNEYVSLSSNDDDRYDIVDSFNVSVLPLLRKIEDVFINYFSISSEDYKILIKELKNSGIFTYYE